MSVELSGPNVVNADTMGTYWADYAYTHNCVNLTMEAFAGYMLFWYNVDIFS